ncbi:enoyl-CoA hydratase/isomerase family protein [Arthrobacter ginkgonis]|uniref:3-hydroxyisobutyryl-CoA hydrolase n=1 Tax=Arthrobacter ginkgonis TaxID=1630594 RepID=A0ABP7CPH1_9MICC
MGEHVITGTGDGLGIITLNRPEKINALTHGMVRTIAATLAGWREDPEVRIVVLRGAGERGFCAGGDIRGFHASITAGRPQDFLDFLTDEFALDLAIATYPKPVVAFMDGLCMGGGVGLAGHAAVRIVTPRSRVGMPETRIGYSPDVGGTHLLGQAPGRLGEHFGLTAASMGAGDAIHAGFADFCAVPEALEEILAALPDFAELSGEELAMGLEILHGTAAPASSFTATAAQGWIDAAYAHATAAEILAALDASPYPGAAEAAAAIRANSPLAVETALRAIRAARAEDDLRSAFEREHRIAAFLLEHPDLAEGIRAQVIDKDRDPHWSPASLAELDPATAAAVAAAVG